MLHCWQFRFFQASACFKRVSMTHPDYCPSPRKDASYWRQWWRARKEISHKASACFLSSTSWGDHHLAHSHKTLSISTWNMVYGCLWLQLTQEEAESNNRISKAGVDRHWEYHATKKYPTWHSDIPNTQIVDFNENPEVLWSPKKCGITHAPIFLS